MVNTAFIGRLNNAYMLSGVGLGNMFINCFWISMYMGINGALETLVSQAFGAKNNKLCGNALNRGYMSLIIVFVPIAIFLFFVRDTLILFKVEDDSGIYARTYCRSLLVGIFIQAVFDLLRKFMICLGSPVIPTVI